MKKLFTALFALNAVAGLTRADAPPADPPPTTWERTFGGDNDEWARSVVETADGGFVAVGDTDSSGAGGWDAYLLKTDPDGWLLWEKRFGAAEDCEFINSLQTTTDGGFIAAGVTQPGCNRVREEYDAYVVKTDPDGNRLWDYTSGHDGEDAADRVLETSDGGFLVVGYAGELFNRATDVYLIKLDPDGEFVWESIFGGVAGGPGFDGSSVLETANGFSVMYPACPRDDEMALITVEIDSEGNLIGDPEERLDLSGLVNCGATHQIVRTSDGFIVTYGVGDVALMKIDSEFNITWQRSYGGADRELAGSVRETSDGGFIVTGWISGRSDIYVFRTHSNGDLLWEKTLGGPGGYSPTGKCIESSDGGYVVAGTTYDIPPGGGRGETNFYIARIEPEADCDGDGTPDATEIHSGVTADCNRNGIPDPCDLASGASGDFDGNLVPDECETEIMVSREEVDFGEVYVGESATVNIHFENVGPADVEIERMTIGSVLDPNPDLTLEPEFEAGRLAPGEVQTYEVIYTPGSLANDEETLRVSSDAAINPVLRIRLLGVGVEDTRSRFLRGDCDGNGSASGNVNDAVASLRYNFVAGSPEPPCLAACDADGNGTAVGQVNDAVYMLAFSFRGGPEPVAPYPDCGPGSLSSDEEIGCETPPADCE